ncbi:MAG: alpha/beta hydrolase [Planctomycetota bacterium]|jgi:lysophospholipase|nr:alpha/beta hydrolase [Planctomycetota bacterium]MDP6941510.1 alpha/beta hydrolase [Planctomycetota bacterium]
MTTARETTIRSSDGTQLCTYDWIPENNPVGEVFWVHGLGEHMGRHDWVSRKLCEQGWRVLGCDLRGHGKSAGKRGHVNSWSDYLADLDAVSASLHENFILIGHSMGGLIALDWIREGQKVAAVALSSPLLGVAVEAPAWKLAAGRLLSNILPRLSMSNELAPELICSDPTVVEAYKADPLVFDTITPRWFTEMSQALERVQNNSFPYPLPLYLNLGAKDQVVSNKDAKKLFENWKGPKSLEVWPNCFHETLNEPVREEVLQKLAVWLSCPA